jgi:hypothetical protein
MLDSEIVFSTRLRAAITDPEPRVLPFLQDATNAMLPYQSVPVELLGQAFLMLRSTNTELLKALPEPAWESTIEHPERGTQPLAEIVRIFGEHIAAHMPELKAARSRRE